MIHLDELLVRRLAGETAANPETLAHLMECPDCRERIQRGRSVHHDAVFLPAGPADVDLPSHEAPTTATPFPSASPEAMAPPSLEAPTMATPESTKLERFGERTRSSPQSPDPALLPVGAKVGRYLILQPLGQGGMGVVYAAYDPELDRKVALKLLGTAREQNDDGQARLLREAQAMARVSHPNVTAVYDAGMYGSQVFLAMELVEGAKTLRGWLTAKPRTWREIVEVMVEAGRGLAAAHVAGLVHRDFKPDNVLVDKDGHVFVTDFGLARLAQAATGTLEALPRLPPASPPEADLDGSVSFSIDVVLSEQSLELKDTPGRRLGQQLTQAGMIIGTPSYMAPEQLLGKPPNTRSDQFSFCTTLYYALYQQYPFEPLKLARAVARGPKDGEQLIRPPPKTPRVPAWVKRVMMRGLELSPRARFESMEALLAQLSRRPASARGRWAAAVAFALIGTGVLAERDYSQQRGLLCSGAKQNLRGVWDEESARRVESAFNATGKPYAAYTFQSVKSSLDGYARDWAAMHTEACEATRIRGEQTEAILTSRMTCLDRRMKELQALTNVLSKADAKMLEHAIEAVGQLPRVSTCADVDALSARVAPPEDPLARAEVARLGTNLAQVKMLGIAGKYREALDEAERVVEAARKVRYPPLLAEALQQKGLLLRLLGRGKEAERTLLEAWSTADASRSDDVRVKVATTLIAVFNNIQSDIPEALRWTEIGEAALARLARSPELEIPLRRNQGAAFAAAGEFPRARQHLERALALDAAINGESSIERPLTLIYLSRVYDSQGESAQALKLEEDATALSERAYGPDHPYSGVGHKDLAEMYRAQGDLTRALPHARRALAVLEAALGPEEIFVAIACDTVAGVLADQQHFKEAEDYTRRAMTILEKTLSPDHRAWDSPLDNLAYIYLQTGRAKQAQPLLERALKLTHLDPASLASVRFHLAMALNETGGDPNRARDLARQALDYYRSQGKQFRAGQVEHWLQLTAPELGPLRPPPAQGKIRTRQAPPFQAQHNAVTPKGEYLGQGQEAGKEGADEAEGDEDRGHLREGGR